jgi:pSer/pThr/pTyr-binding forkhead associated (FHA) protein
MQSYISGLQGSRFVAEKDVHMKTAPVIIVQLIHIEGPLKGQIIELSDPVIKIGRHPSCQLRYPADLAIISREHATITREGNRFKLTDQSSNGTIVNGKKITEIFLKDGDVITVSEGGPKVSFLTRITDTPLPPQETFITPPAPPKPQQPPQPPQPPQNKPAAIPQPQAVAVPHAPQPVQKSKAPLIIQYGPTLRSFDELPLHIGRHPSNEYIVDHAGILDFHAEIYFTDEQYLVKDVTGRSLITANGVPVGLGYSLQKNDVLALSQTGPFFRFLGNGRLSEEISDEQNTTESTPNSMKNGIDKEESGKKPKKPTSFFKKFFS